MSGCAPADTDAYASADTLLLVFDNVPGDKLLQYQGADAYDAKHQQ